MDLTRRIAIMVFSAVPAIMGGGIVYALSGYSAIVVVIYEILLYIAVGFIIRK